MFSVLVVAVLNVADVFDDAVVDFAGAALGFAVC